MSEKLREALETIQSICENIVAEPTESQTCAAFDEIERVAEAALAEPETCVYDPFVYGYFLGPCTHYKASCGKWGGTSLPGTYCPGCGKRIEVKGR